MPAPSSLGSRSIDGLRADATVDRTSVLALTPAAARLLGTDLPAVVAPWPGGPMTATEASAHR